MRSYAHKVRQGHCDPPKTEHVSPLAWHPGRLTVIPAHVARRPATLSTVADAGGWTQAETKLAPLCTILIWGALASVVSQKHFTPP